MTEKRISAVQSRGESLSLQEIFNSLLFDILLAVNHIGLLLRMIGFRKWLDFLFFLVKIAPPHSILGDRVRLHLKIIIIK